MKNNRFVLLIVLLAVLVFSLSIVTGAVAQSEQLVLRMSRDWGYGGFNGDIQSLFSMRVTGPTDLVRVEFYIDNAKIGQVTQLPYNLQFNTDDFALGNHKLYAIGYSANGKQYLSNSISANFVPQQSAMKFILPILGIVLAAILLSALVPFLSSRARHASTPLGAERNYGIGGGGICPKCHRPFALPLLSAHLGFSKLAMCPNCGKWSLVRVESIDKLREAEKAELEWARTEKPSAISDEENLNKEIDDSKYQGL